MFLRLAAAAAEAALEVSAGMREGEDGGTAGKVARAGGGLYAAAEDNWFWARDEDDQAVPAGWECGIRYAGPG